MGIELPAELADVAAQTGVKWPEADEDKMRETAQAWRQTGAKITALISDADTTARSALGTTEGESADAARKHWGTYVQPDTGKLTSMARGCTKAADQLDHAAIQVADAKLAIVQNLVPLAKNKDVAEHAAASGHPTALLGLDTAIKGTAANVANVHSTLVTAVQPISGATVDAVQPIVNPNPGQHSTGLLPGDGAVPSHPGPGEHGKGLLPGVVQPVVDGVVGPGDHGQRPGVLPGVVDAMTGGPSSHGGVVPGAVDMVGGGHAGMPGPVPDGGGHMMPPAGGVIDHHAVDPATGPIPAQDRPHILPADAPTPPAGIPRPDHVVQAASAAAVLDAPPPPVQQSPPPVNQPVAPPPPASGGPFVGGGPTPPPPAAAVPPPVAGQPIPGQQPLAAGPAVQRGPAPVVMPVEPARQMPAAVAGMAVQQPDAAGGRYQERDTVIAIWLVRMFPIGHMPIAADRPSRQLPPPSPEFDYAAGMRFEPNDHPQADLIDDAEALAWALDGGDAVETGPPQEHELAEGHDPLAGQNERDWDRRFVVRAGTGRDTLDTEYAWPPSELFPEGVTAPGEPEVLEPGTVIDRFGTPEGRVFAAVDTTFTQRSLPPSHVNAEYRRYRVLKPLPVWRGISAAWFGQSGGGVRLRTVHPALDLVALGYLAEERDES